MTPAAPSPLQALRERIRRQGPVHFGTLIEAALHGPGGFFSTGGGAGRRSDFLTSPEIGPLFGAVVARFLDFEWARRAHPDPFVVVEAGAGTGTLCRSILAAQPRCLGALRYVCVERSAVLAGRIEETTPVEPAANVFGAVVGGDVDEGPRVVAAAGPVVAVLDELPTLAVADVILANELLDNLAFRLLERTPTGWSEVLIGIEGDDLGEVLVAAPEDLAAAAEALAPDAPIGGRIPLQHGAAAWLRRALDVAQRGRVVIFDYATTTPDLAARPWRQWLRTYRGHVPGGEVLEGPGTKDITCEVGVDQLAGVRPPDHDTDQATWLQAHGIDDLVADARATWHERAATGDLAALTARSRVSEAQALLDPTGLGAFRVLEWNLSAFRVLD